MQMKEDIFQIVIFILGNRNLKSTVEIENQQDRV